MLKHPLVVVLIVSGYFTLPGFVTIIGSAMCALGCKRINLCVMAVVVIVNLLLLFGIMPDGTAFYTPMGNMFSFIAILALVTNKSQTSESIYSSGSSRAVSGSISFPVTMFLVGLAELAVFAPSAKTSVIYSEVLLLLSGILASRQLYLTTLRIMATTLLMTSIALLSSDIVWFNTEILSGRTISLMDISSLFFAISVAIACFSLPFSPILVRMYSKGSVAIALLPVGVMIYLSDRIGLDLSILKWCGVASIIFGFMAHIGVRNYASLLAYNMISHLGVVQIAMGCGEFMLAMGCLAFCYVSHLSMIIYLEQVTTKLPIAEHRIWIASAYLSVMLSMTLFAPQNSLISLSADGVLVAIVALHIGMNWCLVLRLMTVLGGSWPISPDPTLDSLSISIRPLCKLRAINEFWISNIHYIKLLFLSLILSSFKFNPFGFHVDLGFNILRAAQIICVAVIVWMIFYYIRTWMRSMKGGTRTDEEIATRNEFWSVDIWLGKILAYIWIMAEKFFHLLSKLIFDYPFKRIYNRLGALGSSAELVVYVFSFVLSVGLWVSMVLR